MNVLPCSSNNVIWHGVLFPDLYWRLTPLALALYQKNLFFGAYYIRPVEIFKFVFVLIYFHLAFQFRNQF